MIPAILQVGHSFRQKLLHLSAARPLLPLQEPAGAKSIREEIKTK